ncbi:MAG TPA: hypothetical protein VLA19_20485 [Herpetosiphonaceae bacterium]|nr:hypothetical protein [Herpetosiphonaceae bacterium]
MKTPSSDEIFAGCHDEALDAGCVVGGGQQQHDPMDTQISEPHSYRSIGRLPDMDGDLELAELNP